ncbi:hypothetical protein FEM48_Zijuj09G0222500 [Ziziphus jujuba var. spinosa]|uniref:Uncharacterized protein n=1 Tax=Ziziphus jujuba var. spinosa TaxID=714518 RepID=A0A978UVM2_ZIZJJ|nr:hypothetical protein FEM48_Zijuj09G0222500 [Ziziphus jujuba var. spinosa]
MTSYTHTQLLYPLPLPVSSSNTLSNSLQTHQPTTLNKHTPLLNQSLLSTSPPKPISQSRSLASWVETIRFQVRSGLFHDAILTYIEMSVMGVSPDNFVFPAVLKAATSLQDLNLGKQIHAHSVKFGYGSSSVTVANTLVNMYGKCEDIGGAYKVFDKITEKDQVSWNSMIAALCRFEKWEHALEAFRCMVLEKVEPSSFTLVSVALACSNLNKHHALWFGKQVHAFSLRKGDWKTFTINALMAMYSKLGRIDDSRGLFELFEDRDLVTWNTMLSSLSQNDRFETYNPVEKRWFSIANTTVIQE